MLTEKQKRKVDEHNQEVTRKIELGEYKPFERGTVIMQTTKAKSKKKVTKQARSKTRKVARTQSNTKHRAMKKSSRVTISSRITKLFAGNSKQLSTRAIWKTLNKGRKPKQQASIAGVRIACRKLIDQKALKIVKTEHKQWTLARRTK